MRLLIKYLLIVIAATLLSSCRNRNGEGENNGGDNYDLTQTIVFSVSHNYDGKRDDSWGDEYTEDPGNYFENKIQPDGLRVIVYTTDNVKLGEVQDLYYWPSNEALTEYKFMGNMPENFTSHFMSVIDNGEERALYKIMILANCSQGEDEEDLTYNYTCLETENGAIPMWGIKTVDLSSLAEAESKDIGVIKLLRSAAKVEVKLSESLIEKGTVINNAYVNYYNQTGYCLPTGWDDVEYTEELNMTDCFRLYRHAAVKRSFVRKNDGEFYVYVPEYDNTNDNYSEEKAKISISVTHNGKEKFVEDAISFCQYSGGSPVSNSDYNIVRNHIYQYRIVNIIGDDISLEYSVADWDIEDWDNGLDYEEHDFTYPTYHNPVVPKAYFNFVSTPEVPDYKIEQAPVMYYNSVNPLEGAFECYFQILEPADVKWKPNIIGSMENYNIQVYDDNGLVFDAETLNVEIGKCSPNKWYRILVYPLNNNGAGESVVDLGIVFWQKWISTYINLYINGEYGNIRWPESGTNPKLISIRHIEN